jgi:hypothetical protein
VLDAAGRPIAGAHVRIGRPTFALDVVLPTGQPGQRPAPVGLRTGQDGRFSARGLAAGLTAISVRAPGFATTDVDLEAGTERELELRLSPGVVIEGRVTRPDGTPAGGVLVALADTERHLTFLGGAEASTDGDGCYRLADLPDGPSVLQACAEGGTPVRQQVFASAGQTVRCDFALPAAAGVRGRVIDSQGRGVAGAQVLMSAGGMAVHVLTDAEGRFHVTVAGKPRLAFVEVRLRGRVAPSWWGHDVAVDAGELVLRLPEGSDGAVTVRGRVVDAQGQPCRGAVVRVAAARARNTTVHPVDAAGRFELGPFAGGVLTVHVDADGCATLRRTSALLTGETTWELGELVVHPGASLVVRLTQPDGLPVARRTASATRVAPVSAVLYDDAGVAHARLQYGDDGLFRAGGLAAGSYRLLATPDRDGAGPTLCGSFEVTLAAGLENRCEFGLQDGVACTCTADDVLDVDADARLLVQVHDARGELAAVCRMRRDGQSWKGTAMLVPGAYRAALAAEDRTFPAVELDVAAGAPASLHLPTRGR